VTRPDTTDARLSLLHRPPTQRNLSDHLAGAGVTPPGARPIALSSTETDAPRVELRDDELDDGAATFSETQLEEGQLGPTQLNEPQPGPTQLTEPQPGPAQLVEAEFDEDQREADRAQARLRGVGLDEVALDGVALDEAGGNGPRVTDPRVDHRLVTLATMAATDPRYGALRRVIIEAHLPLVHHLAQRFRGRGEPYDDLVQVGTIGLLHSVDRYDPSRGSFAAFAVPTIVGEIRRHFRDRGWAMRIPRRVQDLGRRVSEARETLTHNLDRSPTVQEIAAYLEVDADLVLEALETASAYITVPLPTSAEESDRMAKAFEDSGLELVEQRETLRPLLAQLPAREQRILELRFARGMSQSQIASEVGVSQMHVSRLLAKSLAVLRSGLTEEL
jgi:RNA polymerase sigma-B factor